MTKQIKRECVGRFVDSCLLLVGLCSCSASASASWLARLSQRETTQRKAEKKCSFKKECSFEWMIGELIDDCRLLDVCCAQVLGCAMRRLEICELSGENLRGTLSSREGIAID
jgi:hypothetical protein